MSRGKLVDKYRNTETFMRGGDSTGVSGENYYGFEENEQNREGKMYCLLKL